MHVLGVARTDVRVMRAANVLAKAGFSVTIIDLEYKHSSYFEEYIGNIHVKHVTMFNWYTARRFKLWFLARAVQMFIRSTLLLLQSPADIYHAHDTTALPACFIASLLRKKPLIFDAHELPLSDEVGNARWRGLITPFAKLLTFVVPRCDGVITVSPPIAQEIHNRYADAEVTLVRNIPLYRLVPKKNLLRQYLGVGPEIRIALYQGALDSNRKLDRLIRAAPFLEQNIVIVLMGPDVEGGQAQLETLVNTMRVSERVKLIPSVPYAELLDWTASADIGLIIYSPSYSKNVQMCLPNKLFEYLMAGLPILSSQLDAVAEIIDAYDIGQIVSSLAPEAIGNAINSMLADRSAYDRMRRNALEASRKDLCWEKEALQLIQLYHKILGA